MITLVNWRAFSTLSHHLRFQGLWDIHVRPLRSQEELEILICKVPFQYPMSGYDGDFQFVWVHLMVH